MAWIEDRWNKTVENDDGTTRQVPTSRSGKGLRWRVRYETADGSEHSRSFDKKVMAENFRTRMAAELLAGTYRDPDAGKITMAKYAQEWLDRLGGDDVSREGARFRVAHITAGLGSRRLDQLAASPSLVQSWLHGLDLGPGTARACLGTLSAICVAAVEDGKITRNPCRSKAVTLPPMDDRKIVPLEVDVVDRLREAMPARYRAMIAAGAWCGLRQGEIFALSPDDIDFLRRQITVQRQVKIVAGKLTFALPKRRKTRIVPLTDVAGQAFAAHIAEFGTPEVTLPWHGPGSKKHGKPVTCKLMFASPRGFALQRNWFNGRTWKPALRKAGIPATRENGMHVMRHTYASVLLANGADIKRVAACLGHHNGAFTMRVYGHLVAGGEDRVRNIIDSLFNGPSAAPESREAK